MSHKRFFAILGRDAVQISVDLARVSAFGIDMTGHFYVICDGKEHATHHQVLEQLSSLKQALKEFYHEQDDGS